MTENKTLAEKLDDNLFSDKNFKRIYLVLGYWLILSPLLETIFYSFGLAIEVLTQVYLVASMFIITKGLELLFNFKKINFKNKKIVYWLVWGMFVWLVFISIINKSINSYFFIACSYCILFALFVNLDKKSYAWLLKVFAIEMIIDTIMGLIDLNDSFIPGFDRWEYAMSMQFSNPNWSGFVMIIAGMALLWLIENSSIIWQKALWLAGFSILVFGLFVGGSYAPEFTLFLGEIAVLIYLWIKNKKCPVWILSAFLITVLSSFAVWFFPVFIKRTTANANFFYESLAVVDGKLKTHFVENISKFFNKIFGWNSIVGVAGSDGWGRNDLLSESFRIIFSDAKSFFIGQGSGFCYGGPRVHNCYVVMWLDIGLPEMLMYVGVLVCFIVRFIKVQKSEKIVFLFITFLVMLFEQLFCCIEVWCFSFYVVLLAVLYKELYSAPLKQNANNVAAENLQEK